MPKINCTQATVFSPTLHDLNRSQKIPEASNQKKYQVIDQFVEPLTVLRDNATSLLYSIAGAIVTITIRFAKLFSVPFDCFCNKVMTDRRVTIQTVENYYKDAYARKLFSLDSGDANYLKMQPIFKKLRNKVKQSGGYPQDILQKIKELASCPELIEARAALKRGITPHSLEGISNGYLLLGREKQKLGIFKAQNLDRSGREGCLRERVAYLLDKKDHFAGVPFTTIIELESKHFPHALQPAGTLTGSFQKWIDNTHIAYDDCPQWTRWFITGNGNKIPVDQIHKIAIFDLRTLNCDRHLANFLISDNLQNAYPIDHGLICPENAQHLRLNWELFPQARVPFSERTLNYIEQLDPIADAAVIKKIMPDVSTNVLQRLEVSIRFVKIAAKKGLTAFQMSDLFQRRELSGLQKLVDKFIPLSTGIVPYFEQVVCKKILSNSPKEWDAFLEKEINQYLLHA